MALIGAVLVASAACASDEGSAELRGELSYVRSGGLAGAHDRLVIDGDGRATLAVRGAAEQDFTLSAREMTALVGRLNDANLEDLPDDAASDRPVPDAFTHVVSYDGSEVRTDDASAPADLKPLLAELGRIIERHSPS